MPRKLSKTDYDILAQRFMETHARINEIIKANAKASFDEIAARRAARRSARHSSLNPHH
jgi:hypothetical protein